MEMGRFGLVGGVYIRCRLVHCLFVCLLTGLLLGLDIFLNNWDRLPLIWENEGNPNNIIFSTISGVWAIDQVAARLPCRHARWSDDFKFSPCLKGLIILVEGAVTCSP